MPPPRKFTAEQVVQMRKRYHDGESLTAISRDFDTCKPTIRSIVLCKAYKEVGGPRTDPPGQGARRDLVGRFVSAPST